MPDTTAIDETSALLRSLNNQRQHILGAIEGLSEEDVRRGVLPTGWSCLGLVQHLAIDVEEWWFQTVIAGGGADDPGDDASNAWVAGPDAAVEAVLDAYRRHAERSDEILRATPLDGEPAWWPVEVFGDWRLDTVRQIVLHVLTETACHTGHLDAARELIDGKTWLILT